MHIRVYLLFHFRSSAMGWQSLDIDAGFGGGEETTRFGPRKETGSTLYQVDTLATISANEEVCLGHTST